MKEHNLIIEILCIENIDMDELRLALRKAMMDLYIVPTWREYFDKINVPAYARKIDRNALFINGKIIWKADENNSIPSVGILKMRILTVQTKRSLWKRVLRNHISFFTAIFIAFFPKCPFCWAAYMSIFTALGLGSIPYQPWLLPFLIALLFVNISSLYFTRKRHAGKPLVLTLAGALLITVNKLFFNHLYLAILGAFFLIGASLWNSLSKRMVRSLKYYFQFQSQA
ncbi:MAG: hypothetical protein JWN83_784 [Chitinophagaceae bacterium]|nr:hypothetical protein [Chitinophagaceae bacterium]